MQQETNNLKITREQAFVDYVFDKKTKDKAFRARLRNSQTPLKAQQAWFDVASFCDLMDEKKRTIYLLIGSSIAFDSSEKNGILSIGKAIADCWPEKNSNKNELDLHGPAVLRMKKILACRNALEACIILRPLIRLIQSRKVGDLDYYLLLNDLNNFDFDPDKIKSKWAKAFFGSVTEDKK